MLQVLNKKKRKAPPPPPLNYARATSGEGGGWQRAWPVKFLDTILMFLLF